VGTEKQEAEIGYGLDLGGESFEVCESEPLVGVLTYDGTIQKIIDWFPWVEDCKPLEPGESLTYFFQPDEMLSDEPIWRAWEKAPHFYKYRLLGQGKVYATDHDCICGENPDCPRCDGAGTVDSPAGWWALFAWKE
jgi:hypothetical protein